MNIIPKHELTAAITDQTDERIIGYRLNDEGVFKITQFASHLKNIDVTDEFELKRAVDAMANDVYQRANLSEDGAHATIEHRAWDTTSGHVEDLYLDETHFDHFWEEQK